MRFYKIKMISFLLVCTPLNNMIYNCPVKKKTMGGGLRYSCIETTIDYKIGKITRIGKFDNLLCKFMLHLNNCCLFKWRKRIFILQSPKSNIPFIIVLNILKWKIQKLIIGWGLRWIYAGKIKTLWLQTMLKAYLAYWLNLRLLKINIKSVNIWPY